MPAQISSFGLKHSLPQLWGVLSAESPQEIGVVGGPDQCYVPLLGSIHPTTDCSRGWARGLDHSQLQSLLGTRDHTG